MNKLIFLGSFLILFLACKQEFHQPIENDGTPPAPISNPQVENLSGGARISYTLPGDKDLLYVQAETEVKPGDIRKVQASYFTNSLTIEGFGEAKEYDVHLYAVDRGGNKSQPLTVKVNPLTPPIVNVFQSLEVVEDFGGINVAFSNISASNVVITVFTLDSLNNWVPSEIYYTSRPNGNFSVRGFESQPRVFKIVVNDRWGNLTDTLVVEKTPLYETQLDKSKFKEFNPPLPGNAPVFRTAVMPRLWDNASTDYRTDNGSGLPHHFSFDMGTVAKLSRFVLLQRGLQSSSEYNLVYANGAPKVWEVWGSNNPAADGSYTGWTKLMDCESIKPSGLPLGQLSNEDLAYAMAGENFVFPLSAPAVRYIRFKMLKTWSGADFSNIAELTFFGDDR